MGRKRNQKKNHARKYKIMKRKVKEAILRGEGIKGWKVNDQGNLEIDYHAFKDEFRTRSDFEQFFQEALARKTKFPRRLKLVRDSFKTFKASIEQEAAAFRGIAQAYKVHHYSSFRNADIIQLCNRTKSLVEEQLATAPVRPFHVAWSLGVKVQFKKQHEDTFVERNFFTTKFRTFSKNQFLEQWKDIPFDLQKQFEEAAFQGSGFKVHKFLGAWLNVINTNLTQAGGYIEVPLYKKGLLNIRNNDNYCFLWCLAAALKPNRSHSRSDLEPSTYQSKFKELFKQVDPQDFEGGGLAELFYQKYERLFQIQLQVFEHYTHDLAIYPVYRSATNYSTVIRLLKAVEVDFDHPLQFEKCHFVLIKGDTRPLFSKMRQQISGALQYTCEICIQHFQTEEDMQQHRCDGTFIPTVFECPQPKYGKTPTLPKANPRKKEKVPVVVYADLESMIVPENTARGEKSTLVSRQEPSAYAFVMVYSRDKIPSERYEYTGPDAITHFFDTLFGRIDAIFWTHIWQGLEMAELTPQEQRAFELAEKCCLCHEDFSPKYPNQPKVRHHDHNTGKYVGPAHQFCNLQQQRRTAVTVLFHNFTGYDSHFLVKYLQNYYGRLECIANNGEKFKALIVYRQAPRAKGRKDYKSHVFGVRFVDSMAFQPGSLDTLFTNQTAPEFGPDPIDNCGYYITKAIPYTHGYIQELVQGLSVQQRYLAFKLLMRKGVYPYEWVTSFEKFDFPLFVDGQFQLLPDYFQSSLKLGEQYLWEKCRQAEAVCRIFGFETFLEYHTLYNLFDVYLLADIFESYRATCIRAKGFDPAQFYGTPSLVYECFKNQNTFHIELITDPMLYRKLRHDGMRGGISYWRKYFCEANNPLNPKYDPAKPTSYIFDQDATSLYPWAARQLMPLGKFQFRSFNLEGENMWTLIQKFVQGDHRFGCYFWVDIYLPQNTTEWRGLVPESYQRYGALIDKNFDGDLWEYQDNYPMLVEMKETATSQLSDLQRERYEGVHKPCKKLITDLRPKTDYMIHYQSLLFAIERGWVPTRISSIFVFEQAYVMRTFMDDAAVARSKSQNAQEKDLHKTCMNSLIGKTIENVEDYSNVKLCTAWEKKSTGRQHNQLQNYEKKQMLKPNWTIISENLVIAELYKDKVRLTKPIMLGITVYDVSKILMAQLWYTLQDYFGRNIELLGTDTDSLVFHVKTEDWEGDVLELNQRKLFEGYSFFQNSRFPDDVEGPFAEGYGIFDTGDKMLKSVPGFFKPDVEGIVECVAMRAKNYAFLIACEKTQWIRQDGKWVQDKITERDMVKNKGVPKSYIKEYMRFQQMKECVLSELQEHHSAQFTSLRSIHQTVYAVQQTKSILRAVDDKRYSEDGLTSCAFR